MDLHTSNKKIREDVDRLDEEYRKSCLGSSAFPESNLVVTCVIRQPMDTVGVKSKYRSLHAGISL